MGAIIFLTLKYFCLCKNYYTEIQGKSLKPICGESHALELLKTKLTKIKNIQAELKRHDSYIQKECIINGVHQQTWFNYIQKHMFKIKVWAWSASFDQNIEIKCNFEQNKIRFFIQKFPKKI